MFVDKDNIISYMVIPFFPLLSEELPTDDDAFLLNLNKLEPRYLAFFTKKTIVDAIPVGFPPRRVTTSTDRHGGSWGIL